MASNSFTKWRRDTERKAARLFERFDWTPTSSDASLTSNSLYLSASKKHDGDILNIEIRISDHDSSEYDSFNLVFGQDNANEWRSIKRAISTGF